MTAAAPVTGVRTRVYRYPTPEPESDGTVTWDATTVVVAEVTAQSLTGTGWTYSTGATAGLIDDELAPVVTGRDAFDVAGAWQAMVRACRNLSRPGLTSQAVAAVDIALWDLKARLLDLPLTSLFGRCRDTVPVYGSGGFVSMDDAQLREQVEGWLEAGCAAVKIKVGQDWGGDVIRDLHRVAVVKNLVPDAVAVMVDANGGYTSGQAKRLGTVYDSLGVSWFEEPVSSDDLVGLALLRQALRCDVAAGEYGDSVQYAQRMCAAGAVDCLQIDVTRCAGYTEWLRCAAVAASYGLQVSGHCAPALHAPVAAAISNLRHVEWFADHARLEPRLFDGVPAVRGGAMVPGPGPGPGHGMTLRPEAQRWAV